MPKGSDAVREELPEQPARASLSSCREDVLPILPYPSSKLLSHASPSLANGLPCAQKRRSPASQKRSEGIAGTAQYALTNQRTSSPLTICSPPSPRPLQHHANLQIGKKTYPRAFLSGGDFSLSPRSDLISAHTRSGRGAPLLILQPQLVKIPPTRVSEGRRIFRMALDKIQ